MVARAEQFGVEIFLEDCIRQSSDNGADGFYSIRHALKADSAYANRHSYQAGFPYQRKAFEIFKVQSGPELRRGARYTVTARSVGAPARTS